MPFVGVRYLSLTDYERGMHWLLENVFGLKSLFLKLCYLSIYLSMVVKNVKWNIILYESRYDLNVKEAVKLLLFLNKKWKKKKQVLYDEIKSRYE